MFLKTVLLVVIVAVIWFGFRHFERRDRVAKGNRRTGERSFGERLAKSVREKTGGTSKDTGAIEDTEPCPTCGSFVSVTGVSNCGKPNCPY
ncbi:MAG: hypothetical protein CMM78_06125 [Rhodospirillaceae bacterium]|jgi:uncharacterized protein|uniref:hypothetical protein n=1 Tax=unclassified Hwanghaeella TaxID=2605944 RepID=UPI000C4DEBD0|nr:hypothetical protein [Rhodospirillales bacterium]MAX47767.1 hypothetical protein [Rhodospirillaceae bacterium]|tara:strand:- start:42 stop:314 length:273 start_codon:yes stop_codon:yes gene_type:complete